MPACRITLDILAEFAKEVAAGNLKPILKTEQPAPLAAEADTSKSAVTKVVR